jgi:hypothetical protein
MSVTRGYQVFIGVLMGISGLSVANQNQPDSMRQGLMRDQSGYPPLQQAVPSPTSNAYPQAENLSPVYPAVTTDVTGEYPPIGYEPETETAITKPTQQRASEVQHNASVQYPGRPAAGRPQVPYPYPSQGLNVWTPAVGGFSRPAAPPPPSTPGASREYRTPPGSGASGSPRKIPSSSPYPRQPAPGEYPPLAGESSSGYPNPSASNSSASRQAQPYSGRPPPPPGYGAYPSAPYGPYPAPPYYGGPPYPGRRW